LQQQKSSKSIKSLRFSKNQADLRNIGAFQKIRRIWKILALLQKSGGFGKYWRFYKNQADLENNGAFQKNRQIYKMLARAESPAADFLLDWLKSSRSDPCRYVASLSCRPQVRRRLRLPCFYWRTLSCTVLAVVPARHAKIHAEIKILGGHANFH
jgi:hypothetical protein